MASVVERIANMTMTMNALHVSSPEAGAQEHLIAWTPDEKTGSMVVRFERVVREVPAAVAGKSGEHIVRYAPLNATAKRLAHPPLARLGAAHVPAASLVR